MHAVLVLLQYVLLWNFVPRQKKLQHSTKVSFIDSDTGREGLCREKHDPCQLGPCISSG